jgi:hypothetical protein
MVQSAVSNLSKLVRPVGRVDMLWPVAGSQIRTVLSSDPGASRLPSRDQAIDVTQSLCPSRVEMVWPVAGSQIRTVLSVDPDASRLLSRSQKMDVTGDSCLSSIDMVWPETES